MVMLTFLMAGIASKFLSAGSVSDFIIEDFSRLQNRPNESPINRHPTIKFFLFFVNIVFHSFVGLLKYLSPRFLHELPKQIPRPLLIGQPFGVPLHRKSKGMIR